jgi:hypothetical protein
MTRNYCDECDVLLSERNECLSSAQMPQIERHVGAVQYTFSLNHSCSGPRYISLCCNCVAKILREMAEAHSKNGKRK